MKLPKMIFYIVAILCLILVITFFIVALLYNQKQDYYVNYEHSLSGIQERKLEFSVYDVDLDKLEEKIIETYDSFPSFYIENLASVQYHDFDQDNQDEAIVAFDVMSGYLDESKDKGLFNKIIKPASAGGWPMVKLFGIFNYNNSTKLWEPIFIDYILQAMFGGPEVVLPDKKDIPVLLRVEIVSEYLEKGKLISEIKVEKKYSIQNEFEYILKFGGLDFEKIIN